jgi:flagellar biosynthesis/type III secretory pathway protein FliH
MVKTTETATVFENGAFSARSVERFEFGVDFEREKIRQLELRRIAEEQRKVDTERAQIEASLIRMTPDDWEAQKQAEYERGFSAGQAQARHEAEAQFSGALSALSARIDLLAAQDDEAERKALEKLTGIALSTAHAVLAQLSGRSPDTAQAQALLEPLLAQIPEGEKRLTLSAHPQTHGVFQEILQKYTNDDRRIVMVENPAMALWDIDISWSTGGLVRRTERLAQALDHLKHSLISHIDGKTE